MKWAREIILVLGIGFGGHESNVTMCLVIIIFSNGEIEYGG